jgi:cell wall-associated NlpC family hydrolase
VIPDAYAISVNRSAVVFEAHRWLRTPHHHAARVFGAGVDCAQLLIAVYADGCHLVPAPTIDPYPPDWFLHRTDERLLAILETAFTATAATVVDPEPGDVVVFKFGRAWSHAGIVVSPTQMIHVDPAHGVVLESIEEGSLFGLNGRPRLDYTLQDWTPGGPSGL